MVTSSHSLQGKTPELIQLQHPKIGAKLSDKVLKVDKKIRALFCYLQKKDPVMVMHEPIYLGATIANGQVIRTLFMRGKEMEHLRRQS